MGVSLERAAADIAALVERMTDDVAGHGSVPDPAPGGKHRRTGQLQLSSCPPHSRLKSPPATLYLHDRQHSPRRRGRRHRRLHSQRSSTHGRDRTRQSREPAALLPPLLRSPREGLRSSTGCRSTFTNSSVQSSARLRMSWRRRESGSPKPPLSSTCRSTSVQSTPAKPSSRLRVCRHRGRALSRAWTNGQPYPPLGQSVGFPARTLSSPGCLSLSRENPSRIIVGTDATEVSADALDFAFAQASLRNLPLTVVHCFDDTFAGGYGLTGVPDEDLEDSPANCWPSQSRWLDCARSTSTSRSTSSSVVARRRDTSPHASERANHAGPRLAAPLHCRRAALRRCQPRLRRIRLLLRGGRPGPHHPRPADKASPELEPLWQPLPGPFGPSR